MTHADYADYLALLSDITMPATSLLHSLEQASRYIGFYMNVNRTKFICFKQESAILSQKW